MQQRWNRNIHYHPTIVESIQATTGPVLDVGCGEGQLTRDIVASGRSLVVGIDSHGESIALARHSDARIEYQNGDFLRHAYAPESFGAIVSVAAFHHMNLVAVLQRVCALLRPGGVLAAIGLARSTLIDLPRNALGTVAEPFLRAGRTSWSHPSPLVWPPPLAYREVRAIASQQLSGSRYRRLLLCRYLLTWTKPYANQHVNPTRRRR